MTALDDLRPVQKALVMDLVRNAGVDVSDWKNYKGENPSTNPKYCYNWSFEQAGEVIVLCVWYESLEIEKGKIVFRWRRKDYAAAHQSPASKVWNRRDYEFGERVELAYRQQLPIRLILVSGRRRKRSDIKPKASAVNARLLDPESWAVTEFDPTTGEFVIERGGKSHIPVTESPDLELSLFEGKQRLAFVRHRHREMRARRAKIESALRAGGGRLLCEVPGCKFDFSEVYGEIGNGYAQVHHLLPLSNSPKEGRPTKLSDLAIVCANCHAMIHRGGKCRSLAGLIASRRR